MKLLLFWNGYYGYYLEWVLSSSSFHMSCMTFQLQVYNCIKQVRYELFKCCLHFDDVSVYHSVCIINTRCVVELRVECVCFLSRWGGCFAVEWYGVVLLLSDTVLFYVWVGVLLFTKACYLDIYTVGLFEYFESSFFRRLLYYFASPIISLWVT